MSDSLDIRIVHLLKDPRGFFASFKRRGDARLDAVMARWSSENEEFCDFTTASGIPSITASYDLVAESPEPEFRRLFEFCGMRFTKESLSYWNVEHHGFAANGASTAILKGKGFPCVPGHFATADAAFYGENSQTLFHDQRWRTELTPSETAAIENNVEVQKLLGRLELVLAEKGLTTEAS